MTKDGTDLREEYLNEKKRKAKKRWIRTVIMFYIRMIILIVMVSVIIMLIYEKKQLNEQIETVTAEKEELISDINTNYITKEAAKELVVEKVSDDGREQLKEEMLEMFEDGDSVFTVLENVFDDKIVVQDMSGYYFYDVRDDIAKHGLSFDSFTYPTLNEETGEVEGEVDYTGEGFTVKRGIDVSKFQEKIDWEKVKDDGIDFVIMRCGYRGYGSGKIVEDETFEYNIKTCNELGIDAGVYFFTDAKNVAEGEEEADFVLDLLEEYDAKLQLPIVIDVEQSSNPSKSRTKNVTPEERTDIVIAFCERVKEAGYEPMIYGNLKSHMRMTEIDRLEEYRKWFAYFRTPLRYPYKFDIWQYTDKGKVDGIKGDIDINLMFVKE